MEKTNIEFKLKTKSYPVSIKPHNISFKYAFAGIKWIIETQPNFRIHLLILTFILALTVFLSLYNLISYVEILVVLNISALVIVAEAMNTAIESLGDEIAQGKYKEFVRIAKDASSGAVLLAAIFSVIIGIIIYLPKILYLINLK